VAFERPRETGASLFAGGRAGLYHRSVTPRTEIDERFSSVAEPVGWAEGERAIEAAELFWIATVRPDGRPHVTPLIAVWLEGAAYFCTGADEQKAKNLAANPQCALITGCNRLHEGLDVVIEGSAERVTNEEKLRRIAAAYEEKYGAEWHFDVRDGAFHHDSGEALVFEVAPPKILGFGKGDYSQTRWSFPR
jgi:nitroimidazol reductase NimA-like FMN-containing flavoprotein (pyridoxamine 5'-phosphate oxidase superfamily)